VEKSGFSGHARNEATLQQTTRVQSYQGVNIQIVLVSMAYTRPFASTATALGPMNPEPSVTGMP
jgi:hypothetical protein